MKLPAARRRVPVRHMLGAAAGLMACLCAQAQGLQEAQPGATAADTTSAEGEGDTGSGWRGAPVATSGSLAYDLRTNRASGQARTLQQLLTGTMSASSYLYQPWFASVSGTLGLTAGRTQGGGNEDQSQDRFVTGNARVDLFPRSRFPLDVHVERSDSRIDSGSASPLQYRATNVGVSQRYRPVGGGYALTSSLDQREQSGDGFRDTQKLLVSDFTTGWKNHDLSLGLSQSQAERAMTGEHTQFRSLVGRHNYAPGSELSLNTTVNWSQSEDHVSTLDSQLSVLQLSSVGLWRREGSGLTLTSGLRGLVLREREGERGIDSVGLTLGASYEANRNLRLSATVSANQVQSGLARNRALVGSLGSNWQGDTVELGAYRYDWYASGSLGASRASAQNESSLAGQVGHTLSRAWTLSPQSALVINGAQSLGLRQSRHSAHSANGTSGNNSNFSTAPDSSRTLVNSAAATWTSSDGDRNGYARASFSDSRELGAGRSRFQLFNFQLSGTLEFDRHRTLQGDLTFQRVGQRSSAAFDALSGSFTNPGQRLGSQGASGEITYRQQRVFGQPRLRFVSRLKLAQDVLKLPGTLAAIPDRETRLWENRLEWSVGRLDSQLVWRISEFDGVRREFLMWRLQRAFGG